LLLSRYDEEPDEFDLMNNDNLKVKKKPVLELYAIKWDFDIDYKEMTFCEKAMKELENRKRRL
jgi:hypothetical protein